MQSDKTPTTPDFHDDVYKAMIHIPIGYSIHCSTCSTKYGSPHAPWCLQFHVDGSRRPHGPHEQN